ncbi:MAG: hypothetical protein IKY33_01490 [Clostridia bacterium]|nr:hypothetical protein [Clostridia bacterium]
MSQTTMAIMLLLMLISTVISLCSFIYTVKRDRHTCSCKQGEKKKKRSTASVQHQSKADEALIKAVDKYPGGVI